MLRGRSEAHLSRLLDLAAEIEGGRPFILGPGGLSYREAVEHSSKLASWLRANGLRRGDRALVVANNRVEVILFLFAVARLGAVFTILNPSIKARGLAPIAGQLKPSVVLLDATTIGLAEVVQGTTLVWAGEGPPPRPATGVATILHRASPLEKGRQVLDLEPVCIVYTSGSTGAAKGVVLTNGNLRFSIDAIQERLGYRSTDRIGLFLPLSFDYGLYQVFLAVAARASLHLGDLSAHGLDVAAQLEELDLSVLPVVPGALAVLLKLLQRRRRPLPALRMVTSTGERLPPSDAERLEELLPGVEVFSMYGLTECKRVSILLPREAAGRPGSVGRPLAGTSVEVVDRRGRRLPPGAVGELVVCGEHVFREYWRSPSETALRLRPSSGGGRELVTGDLCRVDEEGFIYFVARADEQLKHRGFRVSPLEIESAAREIGGVEDAALVQSPVTGALHLFVTPLDRNLEPRSVLDALSGKLESQKVPATVSTLPALTRSAHGKLDRRQLLGLLP